MPDQAKALDQCERTVVGLVCLETRLSELVAPGTRMGAIPQSDAAMQLTADIFGLPTSRPHVYETSGLGAAIDAAVGLGLHPDFDTAVRAMTRIGQTFEPIAANHATYDALYHRVYQKMYGRLQPLYRAIQQITGYPHLP